MLRLSKKTEYGLMAMQYLAQKEPNAPISAHAIADACFIPEDLLSKILQTLRKAEYIQASRGAHGGYYLSVSLAEITFLDFVRVFEEQVAVVDCASGDGTCLQSHVCGIRGPLVTLNSHLTTWLRSLSLTDVLIDEMADRQLGQRP